MIPKVRIGFREKDHAQTVRESDAATATPRPPAPRHGPVSPACPGRRRGAVFAIRQADSGTPEASPPNFGSLTARLRRSARCLCRPFWLARPARRQGFSPRPEPRVRSPAADASPAAPFQHGDLKRTNPHPRRITRGVGGASDPSESLKPSGRVRAADTARPPERSRRSSVSLGTAVRGLYGCVRGRGYLFGARSLPSSAGRLRMREESGCARYGAGRRY